MATIRKHLVNAFENVGKHYGWDDGLKTRTQHAAMVLTLCASGHDAWRQTTCRKIIF